LAVNILCVLAMHKLNITETNMLMHIMGLNWLLALGRYRKKGLGYYLC